jgi:hypothetical protein
MQGFGGGHLREGDHLEGLGADTRKILKCNFKKRGGEAWVALIWLTIERRGGFF